jgi:D-galactarolactone cycloisomerase
MMTRYTSYWGYTGFAKNVISAIEIALWDLKGKALGVPVYELLGGAKVEDIELYASGGLSKSLEDLAEELQSYKTAGFRAVKIRDRDFAVSPVEQSRKAIGDEIKLIVDTNQSFIPRPAVYNEALRYARRISEYGVLFLEEPLGVDDFTGYRRLVENSPMPISGGETLNSAALFRRHIQERAFDIVQPDASVIGGIGECLEVLKEAHSNSLEAVCHAYGAAPCQAANVHASFAAGCSLIEWATPPNPLREDLLIETWKIVEGRLQKPTVAGLGIQLTPEIREKYAYIPGTANPGNFR